MPWIRSSIDCDCGVGAPAGRWDSLGLKAKEKADVPIRMGEDQAAVMPGSVVSACGPALPWLR